MINPNKKHLFYIKNDQRKEKNIKKNFIEIYRPQKKEGKEYEPEVILNLLRSKKSITISTNIKKDPINLHEAIKIYYITIASYRKKNSTVRILYSTLKPLYSIKSYSRNTWMKYKKTHDTSTTKLGENLILSDKIWTKTNYYSIKQPQETSICIDTLCHKVNNASGLETQWPIIMIIWDQKTLKNAQLNEIRLHAEEYQCFE